MIDLFLILNNNYPGTMLLTDRQIPAGTGSMRLYKRWKVLGFLHRAKNSGPFPEKRV
jgi:hypothetical protein